MWKNCLKGDKGNDCLLSVNWLDFQIFWQKAAPAVFHSHKFLGPGLRYEIALAILMGDIVWVMGPFPCGDWPNIEIFHFALKHKLGENEHVEANDGYVGKDPSNPKDWPLPACASECAIFDISTR